MDLLPILRRALSGTDRLAVACSGGPDSFALLHAASRWRQQSGAYLACLHVNHGLRRAASADARFVEKFCAGQGIPYLGFQAPVKTWARAHKRGVEEAARILRYRALAQGARRFRVGAVATGHTQDDQAETVFLNLLRGAGPAGLAGMAPIAPWPTGGKTRLHRPLLAVSKKDVLAYLKEHRLAFRTDHTNDQPAFLRNRLRPVLREWERERPGLYRRVAQTAEILRAEEDFWRARLAGHRRKTTVLRLERPAFMGYHKAEQRRRLRHLFGLTRFDVLERVRLFAGDESRGPLAVPRGRVEKTDRWLLFRGNLNAPPALR